MEEEYRKMKFQAALQGVDLDKESDKPSRTSNPKSQVLFGRPSDYEHMTEEEREEATKKMMSHWKGKVEEMGL